MSISKVTWPGSDIEKIAAMTPGMVGADSTPTLVNEAALLTAQGERGHQCRNSRRRSRAAAVLEEEPPHQPGGTKIVAYHELTCPRGSLCQAQTRPEDFPSSLGGIAALGYLMQVPTEDGFHEETEL
jgi:ATP-dependent Zn protease